MSVTLNASQLRQALDLLGGCEETKLTIKELQDGAFAWITEYPEEGSTKLEERLDFFNEPTAEEAASDLELERLLEVALNRFDKALYGRHEDGFKPNYGDPTGTFADVRYTYNNVPLTAATPKIDG